MNFFVFLKNSYLELPRSKVLDESGSTFGDLSILTLKESYMGLLIAGKEVLWGGLGEAIT